MNDSYLARGAKLEAAVAHARMVVELAGGAEAEFELSLALEELEEWLS